MIEVEDEVRELKLAIELTESLSMTASSPTFIEMHKRAIEGYKKRLHELGDPAYLPCYTCFVKCDECARDLPESKEEIKENI